MHICIYRSVTDYERKIGIYQYAKRYKRKRNRNRQQPNEEEIGEKTEKKIKVDKCDLLEDHSTVDNSMESTENPNIHMNIELSDQPQASRLEFSDNETWASGVGTGEDAKERRRVPYSQWDFTHICIPSLTNESVLDFHEPSHAYLPPNVRWHQTTISLNIEALHKHKRALVYEDVLEFSHGGAGWKANIKASNWGEYKRKYQSKMQESDIGMLPVAHLWNDDITPLVRPQDATSTGKITMQLSTQGKSGNY